LTPAMMAKLFALVKSSTTGAGVNSKFSGDNGKSAITAFRALAGIVGTNSSVAASRAADLRELLKKVLDSEVGSLTCEQAAFSDAGSAVSIAARKSRGGSTVGIATLPSGFASSSCLTIQVANFARDIGVVGSTHQYGVVGVALPGGAATWGANNTAIQLQLNRNGATLNPVCEWRASASGTFVKDASKCKISTAFFLGMMQARRAPVDSGVVDVYANGEYRVSAGVACANATSNCPSGLYCLSSGECGTCTVSSDCAEATTPACVSSMCLSCVNQTSVCTGATPVCGNTGACVPCSGSAPCPTGTCDTATGTCSTPTPGGTTGSSPSTNGTAGGNSTTGVPAAGATASPTGAGGSTTDGKASDSSTAQDAGAAVGIALGVIFGVLFLGLIVAGVFYAKKKELGPFAKSKVEDLSEEMSGDSSYDSSSASSSASESSSGSASGSESESSSY
jgi:hypothetical protein